MSPPTTLLAIDPGVHGHGLALFHHGHLRTATYVGGPPAFAQARVESSREAAEEARGWLAAVTLPVGPGDGPTWTVSQVVAEVPVVRETQHQKGDQADLTALAVSLGMVLGRVNAPTTLVMPEAWKGQLPKDVCHMRVRRNLTEAELDRARLAMVAVLPALLHNVWDAVGIGLHHLGRGVL